MFIRNLSIASLLMTLPLNAVAQEDWIIPASGDAPESLNLTKANCDVVLKVHRNDIQATFWHVPTDTFSWAPLIGENGSEGIQMNGDLKYSFEEQLGSTKLLTGPLPIEQSIYDTEEIRNFVDASGYQRARDVIKKVDFSKGTVNNIEYVSANTADLMGSLVYRNDYLGLSTNTLKSKSGSCLIDRPSIAIKRTYPVTGDFKEATPTDCWCLRWTPKYETVLADHMSAIKNDLRAGIAVQLDVLEAQLDSLKSLILQADSDENFQSEIKLRIQAIEQRMATFDP